MANNLASQLAASLGGSSYGQSPSFGAAAYGREVMRPQGPATRLGFDAAKKVGEIMPVVQPSWPLVPFTASVALAAASTTSGLQSQNLPYDGVIAKVTGHCRVTATGVANNAVDRILFSQTGKPPGALGAGLDILDIGTDASSALAFGYPVTAGTALDISAREIANLASTLNLTFWIRVDPSKYNVGGCDNG